MKFSKPSEVWLAIDYGTSNSLLAAADADQVTAPLSLDSLAPDPTVFRSILYFPHGDLCHYGQKAIDEYSENQAEGRLVRSVKKYLPSESFTGSWVDNRMVRLEDLIGLFLLEMRKRACNELGFDVDRVLLGRPAKFSDDPIKDKLAQYRMEKAAAYAGFKEVSFLPEPLAAAFELRKRLKEMKTVLVVDLGGGTSDFTVIRIGPEKFKDSDVLAIGGISVAGDAVDGDFMRGSIAPFLGSKVKYRVPMGNNVLEMPKSLLDHICSPADIAQLQKNDYMQFFRSIRDWSLAQADKDALSRLFTIVEDQLGFKLFEEIDNTKRAFSDHPETKFSFDYPTAEISFSIARPDYDIQIANSTEKILNVMDDTVRASGVSPKDIDLVYCTGGTSKLRMIQAGLRQRFDKEKIVGGNF
ncbi:MAG: Hsp70 family protein, partial [Bdellovibrionota bacterium]